jgi:hypothetical protein
MGKRKPPKFYSNLEDNNHCMQASMLIVLNSLHNNVSWKEINKLTDYDNRYYSWSTVGANALNDRIPGTLIISSGLDYKKFAEEGEEYLKKVMSPAWYKLQKAHASPNFSKEQKEAIKIVKKGLGKYQKSITKIDIVNYLKKYLIIALVDPHIIKNTPGQSGHFVVIYDSTKNSFRIHDPGLPPQSKWKVDHDTFMRGFKGNLIIVPKIPKEII